MINTSIHLSLHFLLPLVVSILFFKKKWKKIFFIMCFTMLVDLDHLLANPIYDSNRCSINFHPLHSYYAIIAYFTMLFLKKPINIIGLGLLLHMLVDFTDCIFIKINVQ